MESLLSTVKHSTEELDLLAASRDLWPKDTLAMHQGTRPPSPSLVLWPRNPEQVQLILTRAQELGVVVVTYGGGSGVCGGARALSGCWVLDTKMLNRIGPLDQKHWSIEVEAGVNGQHLEDHLAARGFTVGHSPSSIWCSTIGGWAAARGAGQFSCRYGVFEDMVLSMRVVSPGKGAHEIDSNQPEEMAMWLGSEGVLGVITHLTLRLFPLPETRWLRGYRFERLEDATEAMRQIMQAELWPSVLRLYDPVDTFIGGKTKATQHGGPSALKRLQDVVKKSPMMPCAMALPLSMPRMVNDLVGLAVSGVLLIAGWEGEDGVVKLTSAAGHKILTERGEDLGAAPGERWFASRHNVSFKLSPIFMAGAFADTMEVAIRWSALIPLYKEVQRAIGDHAVVMAHMSHAYPEGCSIYFSFAALGDLERYRRTWKAALDAVESIGATTTHHHGVGYLKAAHATRELGGAIIGFEAAKQSHDPQDILNRGKLLESGTPVEHEPIGPLDVEDELLVVDGLDCFGDAVKHRHQKEFEVRWPWTEEPLAFGHKWPWQSGYYSVSGMVDGRQVTLGRAPRSAAGPDLRPWLRACLGDQATVSMALAKVDNRMMASLECEHPWRWALKVLRADLRPAVVAAADGKLFVGYRGPAASELIALTSKALEVEMEPEEWTQLFFPSGPLEYCADDDPDAIWATHQGLFKRASR